MQTFVPFPDLRRTAEVLDDRRLGKQRVEALQIIRALTRATYGWKRHPAVRMWEGHVEALALYAAVHRSHRSSLLRKDPEHYRHRFEPDLPDDLPYVWPAPASH